MDRDRHPIGLGTRVRRARSVTFARARAELGARVRADVERLPEIARVTLACAASFAAADGLGTPLPVLAPLGTLVTLRRTAYGTVREGLRQTVGVVAGAAAAVAFGVVVGLQIWTVAVTVFVALLVSGKSTGAQAATTSLLTLALGVRYTQVRVEALVIGTAIGIVVGLATPVSLVGRARAAMSGLADDIARLLRDVAGGVEVPFDEARAQAWLQRARGFGGGLREVEARVRDARESVRWAPFRYGRADENVELSEALTALDHLVGQARTIARTLADLAGAHADRTGEPHPWLALPVRTALADAAEAVCRYAAALRSERDVDGLRDWLERATDGPAPYDAARADDPDVARAQTVLVTESRRVLHEVDPRGAHRPWHEVSAA